ncbi:MAG: arylamine N-acetyltransferase [Candidatus Marinimicrobia bacterium]|nr:arylamine N-acetyltransferase [Candidatus Neomarinimicrobiota bacterium]
MDASLATQTLLDPARFDHELKQFLKDFRFEGEKPSLTHIRAIAQYFSRLPYENVSKILKLGNQPHVSVFRLPDEVIADHIAWHAGGTCFSLTYMLTGIFRVLGYDAHPLMCDLNWGNNNHSAVILNFSGQHFFVDPGYLIFKPLLLREKTIQSKISTETGISLQFQAETRSYSLYTFRKQQFVRRYQFMAVPSSLDVFAEHWKASFDLPGMNNIILTQVSGYEMLFIQGDFIKFTSPGEVKKFRGANLAEKLIQDRFKIPMEKVENARYIIRQRQDHSR